MRTDRPGGEIGRRKGLRELSTPAGNPGVNGVKVGGTSARFGGGNPELSLDAGFVAVCGRERVAVGAEQS
jgi:hypothetical protein